MDLLLYFRKIVRKYIISTWHSLHASSKQPLGIFSCTVHVFRFCVYKCSFVKHLNPGIVIWMPLTEFQSTHYWYNCYRFVVMISQDGCCYIQPFLLIGTVVHTCTCNECTCYKHDKCITGTCTLYMYRSWYLSSHCPWRLVATFPNLANVPKT